MTNVDEILREIETMANHEFLPIVGPEKGKILVETIRKTKPNHVLEIGP